MVSKIIQGICMEVPRWILEQALKGLYKISSGRGQPKILLHARLTTQERLFVDMF